MDEPNLATFGRGAMLATCLVGLVCAAVGGVAGLLAIAWHAVTLVVVLARSKIAPQIGVTALGIAALYALASLAAVSGSDPEDVDRHASFALGIVAFGCALVGVTSALTWSAERSRRGY